MAASQRRIPMLKKILIGLAVVLVAFVAIVSTRPPTFHVERSVDASAPAEVVFANVNDLHAWGAWSPWEKLDPAMKKTYTGPAIGVGSQYAWDGNGQIGAGSMAITDAKPG